jgi:hypothetical protein
MWRAREWGDLLNLIDHLPQNSHYYAKLMHDEGHAKAVVAWREAHRDDEKDKSPGWQSWSPEVDAITKVLDELVMLRYTLVGVNGGKTPPFKPALRPSSVIEEIQKRAEYDRKQAIFRMLQSKLTPWEVEGDT